MDQVSRSTVVRTARATCCVPRCVLQAALRAAQSHAVCSDQRCIRASPANYVALTDVSHPQVLGGVAVSLGLSCLTLSQQSGQGSGGADATSRLGTNRDSRRPVDAQDEATNDALKLQWRSSADRRQRDSSTSTSSNPPKSSGLPADGVFGVDIGGTLAKLVFLEKVDGADSSKHTGAGKRKANFITARDRFGTTGKRYSDLQFPCERLGGVLHFIKFETR